MKKCFQIIAVCLVILFVCSGCGSNTANIKVSKFKMPDTLNFDYGSKTIAQNERYRLDWDDEYKKVVLTDVQNNTQWSTSPLDAADNGVDEFGFPIEAAPRVNSPIAIRYINPDTKSLEQSIGYSQSIKLGNIDVKDIDNGVSVTYYFADEKISVTVDYILQSYGLEMRIDTKKITEADIKLYSIILAPYLCSVKNNSENAYLFAPSGSGAIIYPYELSQDGISYSESVYGRDSTKELYDKIGNNADIKLPICGYKNGNVGGLLVIDEGAEYALIGGNIGSSNLKYSNLENEFVIRGGDDRKMVVYSSAESLQSIYSDSPVQTDLSLRFYPLSGEEADYNGMAKTYRNYLTDEYGLSKQVKEENQLHLKFLGATNISKSFLGVPYDHLYKLTDLDEVNAILKELTAETEADISVELKGYGLDGLDKGEVAGGYDISSKLGSVKELKNLQKQYDGVDFYFDFDIATIAKSGSSWSLSSDIAKGPTGIKAYQYPYDVTIRSQDTEKDKFAYLSRGLLIDSSEKLLKKIKNWDLKGIGVDTVSNISYSDYKDIKHFSQGNMDSDVSEIMNKYKESGYSLLSSSANVYAACLSDQITDAPLISSRYDIFTYDIPFYQMVFKGRVALSSTPINTASNSKDALLTAIEGGCGLSYSVISNFDTALVSTEHTDIHRSLYSDISDGIINNSKALKEFYSAVNGVEISKYEIISKDIRKTEFANGIVLYTNHSAEKAIGDFGEIGAYGFIVKGAN